MSSMCKHQGRHLPSKKRHVLWYQMDINLQSPSGECYQRHEYFADDGSCQVRQGTEVDLEGPPVKDISEGAGGPAGFSEATVHQLDRCWWSLSYTMVD